MVGVQKLKDKYIRTKASIDESVFVHLGSVPVPHAPLALTISCIDFEHLYADARPKVAEAMKAARTKVFILLLL